jgi:hypothetical protein
MSAQWLQALGMVPLVLASRIRQIERRMVRQLVAAGAVSAHRALAIAGDGRLERFVRSRLERAGAIAHSGGGRYYVVEHAYGAFRRRRRTRAWLVLAIMLVAVGVLLARGVFS